MSNLTHNTSIIKASIAAIAITLAAFSIQPVKAGSDKGLDKGFDKTANSLFSLTTNLTSKDYYQVEVDAAPGWLKVGDRQGASGCQENVISGQVLCENVQMPQIETKSAQLHPAINQTTN
jgi:hypothetical protein